MDYDKLNAETWNKIAKSYRDKFMDLDLYNDLYDQFYGLLPAGAKILEIGCGPGNITRYIGSKRPDLQITATDVAPEMVKLAKENNPGVEVSVMDCRNINKLGGQYYAILCGFVIPYINETDYKRLIEDCARLISANGILYLSFIEGDYSQSGYETGSSSDKMYVHYYTEADTRQMLERNSFAIRKIAHKVDRAGNQDVNTVIIIAARK